MLSSSVGLISNSGKFIKSSPTAEIPDLFGNYISKPNPV